MHQNNDVGDLVKNHKIPNDGSISIKFTLDKDGELDIDFSIPDRKDLVDAHIIGHFLSKLIYGIHSQELIHRTMASFDKYCKKNKLKLINSAVNTLISSYDNLVVDNDKPVISAIDLFNEANYR